jgi:hypothetical protein
MVISGRLSVWLLSSLSKLDLSLYLTRLVFRFGGYYHVDCVIALKERYHNLSDSGTSRQGLAELGGVGRSLDQLKVFPHNGE